MKQITIDREGAARIVAAITDTDDFGNVTYSTERWQRAHDAFESAAAGDFTALAALVGTREVGGAGDIDDRAADAAQIAFNRDSHSTEWSVSDAWLRAVVAARRVYSAGECGARRGDGIVCARAPHTGEHRDAGGMCEWEDVPAPAPAPDFRVDDEFQMYPASDNGHGVLRVEWPARNSHGALDCIRVRDGAKMSVHLHAVDPATLRRRHFRAGERCGTVAAKQRRRGLGGEVYVDEVAVNGTSEVRFADGDFGVYPTSLIAAQTVLAADWSAPEAVPCEVKP